jgi:hypothetical protein
MTDKTQHTPGPWWIESTGRKIQFGGMTFETIHIEGPGEMPICFVWGNITEQSANARLIAAAPELLEAAESALEYMSTNIRDITETKRGEMGKLKVAIAKARGEV